MDFEPEEIKRSLTISSSFNHLEWEKHKINIVDTPGDANFVIDTKNSLQAVDGAVVVVDAISGVEVTTEKVWDYANQFNLPRVFFISKMDRERANFAQTLTDIQKILTPQGHFSEPAHRRRGFLRRRGGSSLPEGFLLRWQPERQIYRKRNSRPT